MIDHPSYPPKQVYESNDISYQEKSKITDYNGKRSQERNSESPTEKTSLSKMSPPLPPPLPPLPSPQSVIPTVMPTVVQSVSSPTLSTGIPQPVPPPPSDVIIIAQQEKNLENISEKKQLKPITTAVPPPPPPKANLTWNQQIQNKVFDDTYFTKTKKVVKPYDNGVGHALLQKLSKGQKYLPGVKGKKNNSGSRESSISRGKKWKINFFSLLFLRVFFWE